MSSSHETFVKENLWFWGGGCRRISLWLRDSRSLRSGTFCTRRQLVTCVLFRSAAVDEYSRLQGFRKGHYLILRSVFKARRKLRNSRSRWTSSPFRGACVFNSNPNRGIAKGLKGPGARGVLVNRWQVVTPACAGSGYNSVAGACPHILVSRRKWRPRHGEDSKRTRSTTGHGGDWAGAHPWREDGA